MLVPAIHLVYQVCNITQTYRIAAAKANTHANQFDSFSILYRLYQNIKHYVSYTHIQAKCIKLNVTLRMVPIRSYKCSRSI